MGERSYFGSAVPALRLAADHIKATLGGTLSRENEEREPPLDGASCRYPTAPARLGPTTSVVAGPEWMEWMVPGAGGAPSLSTMQYCASARLCPTPNS